MLRIWVENFENFVQNNLHKIGAIIYSELEVTHLLCKKTRALDGWVDGWMDGWVGKAGLRIAYSNQKYSSDDWTKREKK